MSEIWYAYKLVHIYFVVVVVHVVVVVGGRLHLEFYRKKQV